jgi:hypothetical protein
VYAEAIGGQSLCGQESLKTEWPSLPPTPSNGLDSSHLPSSSATCYTRLQGI